MRGKLSLDRGRIIKGKKTAPQLSGEGAGGGSEGWERSRKGGRERGRAGGWERGWWERLFTRPLGAERTLVFLREFALLLGAGLGVKLALDELGSCLGHRPTLKRLHRLKISLNLGLKLSESLGELGLNEGELALIEMGENAGELATALRRIIALRERTRENEKRLKKALRYPALVLATLVLAFVFVLLFVLPQFQGIFEGFAGELPLVSRLLFDLYDLVEKYYLFSIFFILSAWLFLGFLYKKFYFFTLAFDRLFLKIPLLSGLIRSSQFYYFWTIFGLLLSSGVAVERALKLAQGGVSNKFLRSRLEKISLQINQGVILNEAFARAGIFDKTALSLLAAAMKSARLDLISEELARNYEERQEILRGRLILALEPSLIVCVGAGVLFLALGIFLPLWSLSSLAGGG